MSKDNDLPDAPTKGRKAVADSLIIDRQYSIWDRSNKYPLIQKKDGSYLEDVIPEDNNFMSLFDNDCDDGPQYINEEDKPKRK